MRPFAFIFFACFGLVRVAGQAEPQVMFGTNPRHDLELTKSQLCEACNAIVLEVNKRVTVKRTEAEIYDALDGICEEKNLRIYKFIPPKMKQACEKVLDKFSDDMEERLRIPGPDLGERACGEVSRCLQVLVALWLVR